jgi:hypothetical protein
MDLVGPPEIVREKTSRLTGGRLACTLILERELTFDEIRRFYALPEGDSPRPIDFQLEGRLLRYDCAPDDEAKWRLSAQIYLVKSFRTAASPSPVAAAPASASASSRRPKTDVRRRMGLHSLHR